MHRFVDEGGHLQAFFARTTDGAVVAAVGNFLLDLCADPSAIGATPVPGTGLSVYTQLVPGTRIAVSWVVMKPTTYDVDQPVVLLRGITDLTP